MDVETFSPGGHWRHNLLCSGAALLRPFCILEILAPSAQIKAMLISGRDLMLIF